MLSTLTILLLSWTYSPKQPLWYQVVRQLHSMSLEFSCLNASWTLTLDTHLFHAPSQFPTPFIHCTLRCIIFKLLPAVFQIPSWSGWPSILCILCAKMKSLDTISLATRRTQLCHEIIFLCLNPALVVGESIISNSTDMASNLQLHSRKRTSPRPDVSMLHIVQWYILTLRLFTNIIAWRRKVQRNTRWSYILLSWMSCVSSVHSVKGTFINRKLNLVC